MRFSYVGTVLLSALLCLPVSGAENRLGEADGMLFQAIQKGELAAVRQAIRIGANVNAKDKTGATALMNAALYSNGECMKLLLNKGADPNTPNTFGATALMWSAGDPVKVRLLLRKNANVKATSNSGRTALIIAATYAQNVEVVRLLLAKGAGVKVKDAAGGVAVHTAGGGAVLAAANAGDEAILRVLLSQGGDPNERNLLGITPLMAASQFGRVEPVKVLLDAGANVNDQSGRRPLVKVGLQELGELTPLLIAAPTGNAELVKLLLDHGADVHAKDMRGMTPLMMAASSELQDEETVRLLIARGSDVNAKSNDGQTPAIWAAKWGNSGVLTALKRPAETAPQLLPVTLPDTPHELDLRRSVEKTIALLQASSTEFFQKSGCVGCHHQMLTGIAVGMARDKHLRVNEHLAQDQMKTVVAVRLPDREGLLQGVTRGGAPMADSLLLVSLGAQQYPPNQLTAAMTHEVASMQSQDGAWHSHIVRQPIEYSPFSETAYAIRALQLYGPEGRKPEFARRIERARAWLMSNSAKYNEDRVMRLLALSWSASSGAAIRDAARELLADQRPDGGWAQRRGFESDAYATGQALYALHQAGALRPSDPAYQMGVHYLRNTQREDGSWYVSSRSVKFQPYFDSAFPHEHDQWISAAGSAWAAAALALAVEAPAVASR